MNKKILNKNLFLEKLYKRIAIIILVTFFTQTKSLAIENKIIAKIDNQIITNIDISNETDYLKALNPNLSNLDQNEIFEIAKNSLIREKIKETEISKFNKINVKSEYLKNIIKKIYINLGFKNKKEFASYLNSLNLNLKTIEKTFK